MSVNQEVVLTFNAETGEVEKAVTGLEQSLDRVSKASERAAQSTRDISDAAEDVNFDAAASSISDVEGAVQGLSSSIADVASETGDIDFDSAASSAQDAESAVGGISQAASEATQSASQLDSEMQDVASSATKASEATRAIEDSSKEAAKGVEGVSSATTGLTGALDRMTGGAVSGFRSLTQGIAGGVAGLKTFRAALAATGIGLLITAIASLVSYFRDTEQGAQRLRVITATLGTVFEKFRDILIAVGERLFETFSNPQQALRDFAQALQDNILTRFQGLLDFIPSIAKAIQQLFERDFAGAAQTAADAAGKVVLGVDSVTESFTEGAKAAADYAKETRDAAAAAAELARQENDLKVAEREFLSVRAQTNKTIAENRLLVEDEKLAFEDRIGALDAAIEAEQRTVAQELEFARQRAEILERKAELAKSDEATIQAVAEAQAAVIQLETRSLRTQKRLEGERQSLILQREARAKQEQAAAQKAAEEAQKAAETELAARQKLEDELFKETLSAQEKEELVVQQTYDARIAIAGDDEGLIKAATESLQASLQAIRDKYRKQEQDADKKETDTALAELQRYYDEAEAIVNAGEAQDRESELQQTQERFAEQIALAQKFGEDTTVLVEAQRQAELDINAKYDQFEIEARERKQQSILNTARNTLGLLSELNAAFAGESEQEQKEAFVRQKKIQSAQALISTYESAVQAFKSLAGIPVVGPVLGTAAAAAATATGLANVQRIRQQSFEGGGGAPEATPAPSLSAAATQATEAPQAPQLDLSFLGDIQQTLPPLQTYVISSDVSNAQQANKKIQEQATL